MFHRFFGSAPATAAQVSVADVQRHIAARDPIQLIDVRSADEFQHDGHIAGATLIPLPVLAQRLSEIDQTTPVVVICRSGNRSQVAADLLTRAGYTAVRNMAGGMTAWHRAGYTAR